MKSRVIATTTLVEDPKDIRAQLALKTVEEAKKIGLPIVIVDGGSPNEFCQSLRKKGAKVIKQEKPGLGLSRRQVLSAASNLVENDGMVIWMEPEKWTLVSELPTVLLLMAADDIDLVTLGRKNQDNYPGIQKAAETFANLASRILTGLDWDFNFGPFIANQRALQYFTDYKGEYGDLWEGLNIPRLRVLAAGLKVKYLEVDYIHPSEQAMETGPGFVIKRLKQLSNQIFSFEQEAQKLGLRK